MLAKESTPLLVNGVPANLSAAHVPAGAVGSGNGSYGSSREAPLPSASPEASAYESTWLDRYLPSINDRPFTYKLSSNLSAGVTVALINIPLSLALAVASDTTPQVGIIVRRRSKQHAIGASSMRTFTPATIAYSLFSSFDFNALSFPRFPPLSVQTAIWASLFAAIFGGSQYNIMGPT